MQESCKEKPYKKSAAHVGWCTREPSGQLRVFIISMAGAGHAGGRHDPAAPGLHHLASNGQSREQAESCYKLLQDTGARILDPAGENPYQPVYHAMFFADPDGIIRELFHIP